MGSNENENNLYGEKLNPSSSAYFTGLSTSAPRVSYMSASEMDKYLSNLQSLPVINPLPSYYSTFSSAPAPAPAPAAPALPAVPLAYFPLAPQTRKLNVLYKRLHNKAALGFSPRHVLAENLLKRHESGLNRLKRNIKKLNPTEKSRLSPKKNRKTRRSRR